MRDICHEDEEFFNMLSDFQYELSDLTNFRDFFVIRFFKKAERFEINKIQFYAFNCSETDNTYRITVYINHIFSGMKVSTELFDLDLLSSL